MFFPFFTAKVNVSAACIPGASPSLTHTPCKGSNGLLEVARFVHPNDVDITKKRKMTLDIQKILALDNQV